MHGWKTRLAHSWIGLRTSFWFVPGLMVAGAIVLAAVALGIDTGLTDATLPGWVYGGGADGARALLSTVAGSMVTVAGVGFSITIVALVLASTQFGPRLLSLFMRDIVSQLTLGIFTGTFTYCILVLRTIRGAEEGSAAFVPQLSVTVAIGLTLVSVGALVYFFHHVAVSIQAPKLVAAVARDLDRAIDAIAAGSYRRDSGPPPVEDQVPDVARDAIVRATSTGYVQVLDDGALMSLAERWDLTIRITVRPGLFVVRGNPVLVVRPPSALTDEMASELRAALIIGDVRTPEDDIEYSVRQLVEVALRALSPAINDPFTAMAATDWLGAALARLAETDFPPRHRHDRHGTLRIVADISTFGGILHTIFSRIRHYGGTSPVVLNRLLESVTSFGSRVSDEADRALVRDEMEAVLRMGRELLSSDADLRELERRHASAVAALGGTHAPHD